MLVYLSILMCSLFTFQEKNEHKNDTHLKIRIIVSDTIIQKGDTVKYRYEVENVGCSAISFYPDFVFISYTFNGRESLNDCMIDDNGEKLFYHFRRDIKRKRLSKGKIYISDEYELIDMSKICWDSEDEIIKSNLIISGVYFDTKTNQSIKTDSKAIIFLE